MAIILDAGAFFEKSHQGYLETHFFKALAKAFPEQQFVITASSNTAAEMPENVMQSNFPEQKGLFRQKKLDKWLTAMNAQTFISFCKVLKTNYPLHQILIIYDEAGIANTKNIEAANAIALTSSGLQHLFTKKYPAFSKKSFLLEGIINEPIITESAIKSQFTAEKEYFIIADFDLNQDQLVTVLKGFSAFKRMLLSSWKLMIIMRSVKFSKQQAEQLLSNYKYREDVVVTDEEQLGDKMAEAYALITVNSEAGFPVPAVEAFRVKTPVLALTNSALNSIFGDAIAYIDQNSAEAIGEMLMTLYKEETLRRSLKQKMTEVSEIPNLQSAVSKLKIFLEQSK